VEKEKEKEINLCIGMAFMSLYEKKTRASKSHLS
jgi:hypothetical protein